MTNNLHHLAKRVDMLFSAISPHQDSAYTNGVFICPVVGGDLVILPEDQARYQERMTRGLGCVLLPEKDKPV